jgi:hypothetical protein
MCRRMFFVSSLVLGLASAVLLTYGGYSALSFSRTPKVWVEVPDLTLDNVAPGVAQTVEYVIVNEGQDPARLLGLEGA